MTQTLLDDAAVDAFLAAPAVGPSIDWDAPAPAPPEPKPADPYSWDDLDPCPSSEDPSWAAFGAAAEDAADASSGTKKKLSAAEREKARDEQMLRDARESIRKRGWSEGEVKWRAWLATQPPAPTAGEIATRDVETHPAFVSLRRFWTTGEYEQPAELCNDKSTLYRYVWKL